MRQFTTIVFAVIVAHVYSAPQLISFKDGKIGVNFAGYHASAGLGGLLGNGASGGLFAEAGTPHGQHARAGLGGAVEGNGGTAGGLYAGATAGGNVKAAAGIGGGVHGAKTAGTGYASAQAGDRFASSGLGGETSAEGASGFTFSGTKSFGISSGVVKEATVGHQPIEVVRPVHKEIDVKLEAANEVNPHPLTKSEVSAGFDIKAEAPATVLVKEVSKMWEENRNYRLNKHMRNFHDVMSILFKVPSRPYVEYNQQAWQMPQRVRFRSPQVYVEQPPPPPPVIVEKHIYRTKVHKPHRHHFRKTAYVGGYVGSDAGFEVPAPPPPPPHPAHVVYKTVQPVIQKRVDVGVESDVHAGAGSYSGGGAGGGQIGYTKQVTFQRNPNFFADIFNIPISTLKAVGNFLGNAAGSTNISVQKTATIEAEKDISSKHIPSSSVSSSDAQITVQTPNASKFIDDILSIPINTLGAVNKFLENNVPARKTVQVSEDGEPTKVRLGPHARRRANKHVVVVQEHPDTTASEGIPPE